MEKNGEEAAVVERGSESFGEEFVGREQLGVLEVLFQGFWGFGDLSGGGV